MDFPISNYSPDVAYLLVNGVLYMDFAVPP